MTAASFQSTKTYTNYPCCHRQHRHDGNCAVLHGYSRSFYIVFEAQTLDACGFAVDFGKLKPIKAHLDYMFDHTLLLCDDDPLLPQFRELEQLGACAIRIMRSTCASTSTSTSGKKRRAAAGSSRSSRAKTTRTRPSTPIPKPGSRGGYDPDQRR
jgi:6-pyruvoyl-tetrahydropterin synthase